MCWQSGRKQCSSLAGQPYFPAHPTNVAASKTSSGTGFVYGMKG